MYHLKQYQHTYEKVTYDKYLVLKHYLGSVNLNLMVHFDIFIFITKNLLYIFKCIIMINKLTYQEVIDLEVYQ